MGYKSKPNALAFTLGVSRGTTPYLLDCDGIPLQVEFYHNTRDGSLDIEAHPPADPNTSISIHLSPEQVQAVVENPLLALVKASIAEVAEHYRPSLEVAASAA